MSPDGAGGGRVAPADGERSVGGSLVSASSASESFGAATPGVSCCDKGFPAFWLIVVLESAVGLLCRLLFPDIATAAVSGGRDPCKNGGEASAACRAAVEQVGAVGTLFGTVSSVLGFFTGPMVGVVADVVGRRPMIILVVALTKFYVLLLLSVALFDLSIYVLFFAELVALVPPTVPYTLWLTDRTTPQDRTKVFARLQAATKIEGVVVPLFTTLFSRDGFSAAIVVIGVVDLVIAVLFLRESKPRLAASDATGPREPLNGRRLCAEAAGTFGSRFAGVRRLWVVPLYRRVLVIFLLGNITLFGTEAAFYLYLKARFGLTAQSISPLVAVSFMSIVVVQVGLAKPMEVLLGKKWLLFLSIFFGLVQCSLYVYAPTVGWIYLACALTGPSEIAQATMLALVTNIFSDSEGSIGGAIGVLQSITVVAGVLGPLLFRSTLTFFLEPRAFLPATANSPWVLAVVLDIVMLAVVFPMPAAQWSAAECGAEPLLAPAVGSPETAAAGEGPAAATS